MEIILVRHGVAEGAEWMSTHQKGDFERPLTSAGAQEMRSIAAGLATRYERPDLILTSPFVRARETGQILADAFGNPTLAIDEELQPESAPSSTAVSVGARSNGLHRLLCVGHEPHLSSFIGHLVTGAFSPVVKMGRGSVCILRFEGGFLAGRGIILTHIPRWFWK